MSLPIAITQGIAGVRRPFGSKRDLAKAGGEAEGSSSAAEDEALCTTPYELQRLRLYKVLEDPSYNGTAKALSLFILLTITVSIVNFMVASYPWDLCGYEKGPEGDTDDWPRVCAKPDAQGQRGGSRLDDESSIQLIETVCIVIFTTEYLVRFCVCTAKTTRLKFLIDPLNLLDVLAIMPWYIDLIVSAVADSGGGGAGGLGVLRIVRLTRVLRVFKVSKSMQSMIVLMRTLKRSFSAFMILLTSILVTMLLFGSLVSAFERGTWVESRRQYLRADASSSPFLSIPHCMYWCMTSMTTVGYGDMYPVTAAGQIVAMVAMVSGIVVLSVPITVIGANFDEETREQHRINQMRKRVGELEKAKVAQQLALENPVAGMQEINCLLEDYRNNVVSDLNMVVAKSEPTFTQLVRKVVIQSRVFSDPLDANLPDANLPAATGMVAPGSSVEVDS
mmetsp:Transcript_32623/g.89298  ORF Transcript_32623/g.89298 Transcript_32623/m.89298 type:complete len:448 (+) Transcript_32623:100-1443(+)